MRLRKRFLAFGLFLPVLSFSQALSREERQAVEEEIQALREQARRLQQQLESLEKRLSPEPPPPAGARSAETGPAAEAASSPPVDVSGYFSARYFNDTSSSRLGSYQSHTASFFFGKTLGRWRFHSEVELEYSPELNHIGAPISSSSGEVLLETAWLNYLYSDWLNGRAGLLLTPTYWRVHHYPSTTLTVQNPLIDKRVFPPNIIGGMVYGSRYFNDGGFDYTLYAGNGREFETGPEDPSGRRAVGGTFLVHVPNRRFFDPLDLGVQLYRDTSSPGDRRRIYGFESRMERGRLGLLGEFAHADVGPAGGPRRYFREGYYLQPSVRLTRRLHLLYRYDRINYDSRSPDENSVGRHTVGWNYRPVPTVSLKLEFNRYRPQGSIRSGYSGLAAGVAFFFQ